MIGFCCFAALQASDDAATHDSPTTTFTLASDEPVTGGVRFDPQDGDVLMLRAKKVWHYAESKPVRRAESKPVQRASRRQQLRQGGMFGSAFQVKPYMQERVVNKIFSQQQVAELDRKPYYGRRQKQHDQQHQAQQREQQPKRKRQR
jgi:hypothetical protein